MMSNGRYEPEALPAPGGKAKQERVLKTLKRKGGHTLTKCRGGGGVRGSKRKVVIETWNCENHDDMLRDGFRRLVTACYRCPRRDLYLSMLGKGYALL